MACIWKQNLSYWRNIDCSGVRIVHTVLYFTYYGMMLVAISSNLSISSMTTSVPNSILNLLPGFVIPKITLNIQRR
ncbi:hypothetical protein V2J09_013709 [Rumex salicifolius]